MPLLGLAHLMLEKRIAESRRSRLAEALAAFPTDPFDADAVSTAIESWSDGGQNATGLNLREYLGWSEEMFFEWSCRVAAAARVPGVVIESHDEMHWSPP